MMLFAVLSQFVVVGATDVASLIQPSSRFVAAANLNNDAYGQSDTRNNDTKTRRLAVIIAGLQDRGLAASKLEQVVHTSLAAGWKVDVFVALVRSHAQKGVDWNPIEGFVPSPDFDLDGEGFNRTLMKAGARLAHFETLDAPDVLIRDDIDRLTLYPPHNNSVGANAIRRYYKLELLAKEVLKKEQEEHMRYSFVLSTKDDDEWMGALNLANFAMDSQEYRHMYDKDCASWGGVNDKTLLFGRYAFEAVLPSIYSEFWMDEPTLRTHNSETFTKAYLGLKHVTAIPVPFSRLPTLDTVYVYFHGELQLCQKDRQPLSCLRGDSDFVEHRNISVLSDGLKALNLCKG